MWPFTRKPQAKPKEEHVPEWIWVTGEWEEVLYCHCGARTRSLFCGVSNKSPEHKPCRVCGCVGGLSYKVSRLDVEVDRALSWLPPRATKTVFWEGCTQEAQQKDSTDKE